ncbi:MAG: hypothetical protein LBR89_02590 [Holosporales bacterium]|nr:hypothetical protein [Holosporales bacterium]
MITKFVSWTEGSTNKRVKSRSCLSSIVAALVIIAAMNIVKHYFPHHTRLVSEYVDWKAGVMIACLCLYSYRNNMHVISFACIVFMPILPSLFWAKEVVAQHLFVWDYLWVLVYIIGSIVLNIYINTSIKTEHKRWILRLGCNFASLWALAATLV